MKTATRQENRAHETPKLYKILAPGQKSAHGGEATWKKGKWMPKLDGSTPCEAGMYHLCREQDLPRWIGVDGAEIWEAEARGETIIHDESKVACREARITKLVCAMDDRKLRIFAADCAEYALRFVHESDKDIMPTLECAIYVVRCYADGQASNDDLAASWVASEAASEAASLAASWAASRAASWAASWAASRAASEAAYSDLGKLLIKNAKGV
jgi:hypothetical protein